MGIHRMLPIEGPELDIMLPSMYANFHLFAFLLKLISVLQAVFLLIHSNKGLNLMQSSLHLRPKGSAFSLFSLKNKCPFLVFLTVSSAKIVVISSCCTKIPGYKTHPYFSTT